MDAVLAVDRTDICEGAFVPLRAHRQVGRRAKDEIGSMPHWGYVSSSKLEPFFRREARSMAYFKLYQCRETPRRDSFTNFR